MNTKAHPQQTIDMTPTWSAMLPYMLEVIKHGTGDGRKAILGELKRMAELADERNELAKKLNALENEA